MSNLEERGLLYSPHTSSGRIPTDKGLKFFVDGILEIGDLSSEEKDSLQKIIDNLQTILIIET